MTRRRWPASRPFWPAGLSRMAATSLRIGVSRHWGRIKIRVGCCGPVCQRSHACNLGLRPSHFEHNQIRIWQQHGRGRLSSLGIWRHQAQGCIPPSCDLSKKEACLPNANKQMSHHAQFQTHSNSHRSLSVSHRKAHAPVMFPDYKSASDSTWFIIAAAPDPVIINHLPCAISFLQSLSCLVTLRPLAVPGHTRRRGLALNFGLLAPAFPLLTVAFAIAQHQQQTHHHRAPREAAMPRRPSPSTSATRPGTISCSASCHKQLHNITAESSTCHQQPFRPEP